MHKLLINKELRINYVPEIRNGCSLWEQALRRYCEDRLVFERWFYTSATILSVIVCSTRICSCQIDADFDDLFLQMMVIFGDSISFTIHAEPLLSYLRVLSIFFLSP